MHVGSSGGEQQDQVQSGQGHSGWHPDPLHRYELRYFNGRNWTADVAVGGQRFVDPLPLHVPAPVPGRGPAGPTPSRAPHGLATAALVVAITSAAIAWVPFIFVLGTIGAFVALGLGVGALRASRRHEGAPGRRASVAALWLVPLALVLSVAGVLLTIVAVHQLDEYIDPGQYVLTSEPCTERAGIVTFAGTIRNDSTKRRDYIVTIEYRDTNRRLLDTKTLQIERVAPGELSEWSQARPAFRTPATCEVSDVRGPAPFGVDD